MFYDHNILHMWQGQFVSIMLYEQIGGFLFYLGDLILNHVMCKTWMRWSHNLSRNVKVIKSFGRPNSQIITKMFLRNLSK
jgi:hypothetical protein